MMGILNFKKIKFKNMPQHNVLFCPKLQTQSTLVKCLARNVGAVCRQIRMNVMGNSVNFTTTIVCI